MVDGVTCWPSFFNILYSRTIDNTTSFVHFQLVHFFPKAPLDMGSRSDPFLGSLGVGVPGRSHIYIFLFYVYINVYILNFFILKSIF